jgi:hypothetical protein
MTNKTRSNPTPAPFVSGITRNPHVAPAGPMTPGVTPLSPAQTGARPTPSPTGPQPGAPRSPAIRPL